MVFELSEQTYIHTDRQTNKQTCSSQCFASVLERSNNETRNYNLRLFSKRRYFDVARYFGTSLCSEHSMCCGGARMLRATYRCEVAAWFRGVEIRRCQLSFSLRAVTAGTVYCRHSAPKLQQTTSTAGVSRLIVARSVLELCRSYCQVRAGRRNALSY